MPDLRSAYRSLNSKDHNYCIRVGRHICDPDLDPTLEIDEWVLGKRWVFCKPIS